MMGDAPGLHAGVVPWEAEHRDAEGNHLSSVQEPFMNIEPVDMSIETAKREPGDQHRSVRHRSAGRRDPRRRIHLRYLLAELHPVLNDLPDSRQLRKTLDNHRQSTPHDDLVDRTNSTRATYVVGRLPSGETDVPRSESSVSSKVLANRLAPDNDLRCTKRIVHHPAAREAYFPGDRRLTKVHPSAYTQHGSGRAYLRYRSKHLRNRQHARESTGPQRADSLRKPQTEGKPVPDHS